MRLRTVGFSTNRQGDLKGTVVAVSDQGESLGFEHTANFSNIRERRLFIEKCSEETGQPVDVVTALLTQALKQLREAGGESVPETEGRQKKADLLIKLVKESEIYLFHDQVLEPYAALQEGPRRVVLRLGSLDFKRWVARRCYEAMGEIPSTETLRAALQVLEGQAVFDGPLHPLNVRMAWHQGELYYDLGDWRAVRVSHSGWQIVQEPPILFRHFPHQKPQVEPQAGGDLHALLDLMNLRDGQSQLLYLCALVAGLIPDIPRALMVVHGAHGSAKSCLHRFYAALLDPSDVTLSGMPRDVLEFTQLAGHSMTLFLDNLTSLPEWLSDALCRYCTGYGFRKRRLWTDDDDFVSRPQGIGGINGVNLVITEPDLLDRALVFELQRIPDDEMIDEKVLEGRFEELLPSLLGALFTALSRAMSLKETLGETSPTRMADYARWGCAAAVALGYSADQFWQAWRGNVETQTTEALDASPVAQAAMAFMSDLAEWEGSPAELLEELNARAEELKIDATGKAWPKEARWVYRRLNLVSPNLAQIGIRIYRGWIGKKRVLKMINIRALGENDVGDVGDVDAATKTPATDRPPDTKATNINDSRDVGEPENDVDAAKVTNNTTSSSPIVLKEDRGDVIVNQGDDAPLPWEPGWRGEEEEER